MDLHQNRALRGNVGSHVEAQRRVDELHRYRVVGDSLNRDLQTTLDRRSLVVESGDLGRRDDVDETLVLGRDQRHVELERIEDVAEADVQKAVRTAGEEVYAAGRIDVVRELQIRGVAVRVVGDAEEIPLDAQ